jgi:hypothetical protein
VEDGVDANKVPDLRKKFPSRRWRQNIFQGSEDTPETVDGKRRFALIMTVALKYLYVLYVLHNSVMWCVMCRYLKVGKASILALKPFLKKLQEEKEELHEVSGHALIRSLPGCRRQGNHTDYFDVRSHGKVEGKTMPYTCLVALEGDSFLYIEDKKIALRAGNVAIMRGDVVHAGSEYAVDNIRYHVYMDVAGVHKADSGDYVRWA